MKPLFGEFGVLRWVRIIVVALTCVYFYFGWLMVTSTSDYVDFPYITFLILSCIPIGKVIQDKSDMVQWMGPVPTLYTFLFHANGEEKLKEEIIREYSGESDDSWVKRKITRYATAYISGVAFSSVCFVLGLLFVVFLQSNIILDLLPIKGYIHAKAFNML